ncbi:MAG: hypothetical protein LBC62_01815 [Treponema sp.]|jgi:hypothetical protein|nr:hypothetical protein [Treponema sp.]
MDIGWAQADITPLPGDAKKVSLFGQLTERITSEVRDRIHAVVLVLDDGKSMPSVLVSADLLGLSPVILNAVRAELKKLVPEIPPEAVTIWATHIHTAPAFEFNSTWGKRMHFQNTDPDVLKPAAFTAFLAKKIGAAAAEAWKTKKRGGIALKTGRIAVPQCRRIQFKDGTAAMYGNSNSPAFLRVEGAADNGAEYLVTYDESGKITGTAINLCCPAQILEHQSYITADLWGEVRKQLNEVPYILPICGASGDLTMRDLVRRDRTEPSTRSEEGLIDIASRVVRESRYYLSAIKKEDIRYDIPYSKIKRDIELPLRTVTEEEYIEAKRDLDAFEKEYERNGLAKSSPDTQPLREQDRMGYMHIAGTVERWELQKKSRSYPMELHVVRIGEAVLATNSFELYQEFGNQIKALSPAPYTFIAQLANDYQGYLCNEVAKAGGSYSSNVENGFIGPEGGDCLVAKTLDAIVSVYK